MQQTTNDAGMNVYTQYISKYAANASGTAGAGLKIANPDAMEESKSADHRPIVIVKHCDFKYKMVDEEASKAKLEKEEDTILRAPETNDDTTWQDIFDRIFDQGASKANEFGKGKDLLPTLYYEDEDAVADDAEICKKRFPFSRDMTLGDFKQTLRDNLRSVAANTDPLILNYVEGIFCDEANCYVPHLHVVHFGNQFI